MENITKICSDCNETDRSMCTEGGLQIPTSRSVQLLLANGIERRIRMLSDCYNDSSCMGLGLDTKCIGETEADVAEVGNFRRTRSCPAINLLLHQTANEVDKELSRVALKADKSQHRLQKSGKMLDIPTKQERLLDTVDGVNTRNNVSTQTIEFVPQNYEYSLFQMLLESVNLRNTYEPNKLGPQEILDLYVSRTIRSKDTSDMITGLDQVSLLNILNY